MSVENTGMALNKQTNCKGKSCPEYEKLRCFQGVLISDTMCKEPSWVREGVSLDHSNRGQKHVPFAERDQSVFLCLEEEFKAQQGPQGLPAVQALAWI